MIECLRTAFSAEERRDIAMSPAVAIAAAAYTAAVFCGPPLLIRCIGLCVWWAQSSALAYIMVLVFLFYASSNFMSSGCVFLSFFASHSIRVGE